MHPICCEAKPRFITEMWCWSRCRKGKGQGSRAACSMSHWYTSHWKVRAGVKVDHAACACDAFVTGFAVRAAKGMHAMVRAGSRPPSLTCRSWRIPTTMWWLLRWSAPRVDHGPLGQAARRGVAVARLATSWVRDSRRPVAARGARGEGGAGGRLCRPPDV